MFRLIIVVIVGLLVGCSDNKESAVDTGAEQFINFELMEVMKDAEFKKLNYKISIALKSPLIGREVTPYIVDFDRDEIIPLDEIKLTSTMRLLLDFDFQEDREFSIFFHVKRVGFSYNEDRPLAYVCHLDVRSTYITKQLACNLGTTSTFILSHVSNKEVIDFKTNIKSLNTYRELVSEDIFNTQTLQNVAGVISIPLAYVTLFPHSVSSDIMNDGMLTVFSRELGSYFDRFTKRQYMDIESYEKKLKSLSVTFDNFGFKVFKDRATIFKLAFEGFPLLEKHPIYVSEFFAGTNQIKLINREAYKLVNVVFDKSSNVITWQKWPWMEGVKVTYNNEEQLLKDNYFNVPDGVDSVLLQPFTGTTKYRTSTVTQLNPQNAVVEVESE